MGIFDIDGCEQKIGYVFQDKMLLRKCFTHASYVHENGGEDNERLEFFGDAILELIVTEYLYDNYAGDEGDMTLVRASLVSKEPLLKMIKKLDISQFMLIGKGTRKTTHQDEKMFSSLYEALVAGIYLDGGLLKAKKFIYDTLIKDYQDGKKKTDKKKTNSDYKSKLQEYVQKRKMGSIEYILLSKVGPDHMPTFRVAVTLNNGRIAEAEGSSKKNAENKAAEKGYKKLLKQGGKNSEL